MALGTCWSSLGFRDPGSEVLPWTGAWLQSHLLLSTSPRSSLLGRPLPPSLPNASKSPEMIKSSFLLGSKPSGAKGQAALLEPHPTHPNQDKELNG